MRVLLRLAAAALFATVSFAQLPAPSSITIPGSLPATPQRLQAALFFDRASYKPGDPVKGALELRIQDGWHINSNHPLESYAIPSTATITSSSLRVDKIVWPPHVERALSFAGGAKLAVYEGTITLPFTGVELAGGDQSVHVKVHYQACDDSVCLPPRDLELDDRIGTNVLQVAAVAPNGGTPPATTTARPSSDFTPLSQAPPAGSRSLFSGDISGIFHSRGLLLTLVAIFFVGLALNLTPCVYPLIPITLAFFASQTEGKKGRQIGLAAAYVAGLAGMYALLGVVAALTGSLFGSWLQSPVVLIFFALLMLVLAASMFGLFEIQVPHFISDRAGAKSGYAGALVMGLFAGVVAAPCVGPVVVSLIALVSQLHDPLVGTLMFLVLAIGLGFPYLIGLSSLPRSGAWMVTVKKALGFILIAMAFYFLRAVAGELVFHWGVAISLFLGALFLFAARKKAGSGRALSFALAALLLIGAIFFVPRPRSAHEMSWETFSPARLAAAQAAHKPVVVDFYADWCIPCKELDEKTFSDARVISAAGSFVRLKADLTRSDDAATQTLSRQYKVIGVPTVIFLDSSGREVEGLRLTGMEKPDAFLKRLQSVR